MFNLRHIIKEKTAAIVTQRFPQALYFLADKAARRGLRVACWAQCIDIIDPLGRRVVRISRAHSVYLIDMIASFDYYHSSAQPSAITIRKVAYQLVDFSTARFQIISGFDDFPIMCPSLTEPFITTQQYIDFAQIPSGGIALDLGSYSGLVSIAFSKIVGPTGRVIAVEPDPSNFKAAKLNFSLHTKVNRLDNIELTQAAITGGKGVIEFSSEGSMGSAEVGLVGSYRGASIKVPSLALSDLAQLHALERVDFIKMDIEGSEAGALRASGAFFKKYRPRLIIEPHMVNGLLSNQEITHILTSFGYRCLTIQQHGVALPLVTAEPV